MARIGIPFVFVLLLKLSSVLTGPLHAQWIYNPTLNTPVVAGAETYWATLRTTDEDAYFFWKERDTRTGQTALMGQKLDRGGYRQWPWKGRKFAEMGTANQTNHTFNAIVLDSCILLTWVHRILLGDSCTVFVQCIDLDGMPLWPQPRILKRQQAHLSAAWTPENLRMHARNERETWLLWLTDGEALHYCSVATDGSVSNIGLADTLTQDPYSYTYFNTFSDGRGGVYVLSQLKRKPGEPPYTEIRLRHVDSTGICTAIGGQRLFTRNVHMLDMAAACLRDSTIIIGWWEGLDGHTGHLQWTRLLHQRYTPSGQPLYVNGGRTIEDSAYYPVRLDFCVAADSGVYACFGEVYNGLAGEDRLYVQRIENDGSLSWGSPGRLLSRSISGDVLALFAGEDGGIIVTWQEEPRIGSRGTDIYTQRIDADGTVRWQSDGVPVSQVPWTQYNLSVAALGDSLVLTWNDRRPDSLGVYAALIDPDGGRIPVTLLSFDAVRTAEGSLLRWTAEGEEDAYAYIVQRASHVNAGEWIDVATVASTAMHGRQKHRFVDASPPAGTLRYRLACLHYDGSIVYSPVVTLQQGATAMQLQLDLYPQPARSHATISLQSAQPGTLLVYDAMGREQRRFSYAAGATALHWDLNGSDGQRVAPGIYYLRTTGTQTHTRAVIVR